jgi:golgi apparatus protein 1
MRKVIRTMALVVPLISLVVTTGSDPLWAAEDPCKADVKRLCGDIQPGQGRIQECLKAHKDEVSQECKDSIAKKAEAIQSKLEQVEKACSGDAQKFCKEVEPGQGRIMKCLMQHKAEVSQECRDTFIKKAEALESKVKTMQKACSGDVQKFCKEVEPGQGRIMKCLMQHKAELSDPCKASMGK